MKKYMVADFKKDLISDLLESVKSKKITLSEAQEAAWVQYGYSEGGTRSGTSRGRWAERTSGGSDIYVEVDYEPMFESLGDELDDDPIWEVTRISIRTQNEDYPHSYDLTGKYEHSLESIDFLEENSPLRWFNRFVSDQRFA